MHHDQGSRSPVQWPTEIHPCYLTGLQECSPVALSRKNSHLTSQIDSIKHTLSSPLLISPFFQSITDIFYSAWQLLKLAHEGWRVWEDVPAFAHAPTPRGPTAGASLLDEVNPPSFSALPQSFYRLALSSGDAHSRFVIPNLF